MVKIINGDLLQASEQYIVHQTNCISKQGGGLAYYLFNKFPYADCYANRIGVADTPGTIKIAGDGYKNRFVINLMGQYCPGKHITYDYNLNSNDYLYKDTEQNRQKWFYEGLAAITKISNCKSIAFPYMIGCGLGGGNWDYYYEMIDIFSKYMKSKFNTNTVIYKID